MTENPQPYPACPRAREHHLMESCGGCGESWPWPSSSDASTSSDRASSTGTKGDSQ